MGFLAAPSKYEGVAALEAHHDISGGGPFHQQLIDFVLGKGLASPLLADKYPLRRRSGRLQQGRVHQAVIDHHIGLLQATQALNGD